MEKDEIKELEEIEATDAGRWRIQEVKEALRETKPRKAAGADEVDPHLLADDMEYTAIRLTRCCNRL